MIRTLYCCVKGDGVFLQSCCSYDPIQYPVLPYLVLLYSSIAHLVAREKVAVIQGSATTQRSSKAALPHIVVTYQVVYVLLMYFVYRWDANTAVYASKE